MIDNKKSPTDICIWLLYIKESKDTTFLPWGKLLRKNRLALQKHGLEIKEIQCLRPDTGCKYRFITVSGTRDQMMFFMLDPNSNHVTIEAKDNSFSISNLSIETRLNWRPGL